VEEVGQQQILQRIGCDQAQGFLYAKPLGSEQFEQLLQTGCECPATAISAPVSG
jgi:EAL domain-containing protein (putative c-di-GMP-specific phosphodiesterase class I)